MAEQDGRYQGEAQAVHVSEDSSSVEPTGPDLTHASYVGQSQKIATTDQSPAQWDNEAIQGPSWEIPVYPGKSQAIHVFGEKRVVTPPEPIPSCKCCEEQAIPHQPSYDKLIWEAVSTSGVYASSCLAETWTEPPAVPFSVKVGTQDTQVETATVSQAIDGALQSTPIAWKVLAVLFRYHAIEVDVGKPDGPEDLRTYTRVMTPAELEAASASLRAYAQKVQQWSGGWASIDLTIKIADNPLTQLGYVGGYLLESMSMAAEIPSGGFDSLIGIYADRNEDGSIQAWAPWSGTAYDGVLSIAYQYAIGNSEIFVHEWLHMALDFYHSQDAYSCQMQSSDLDQAGTFGYAADSAGSWRTFLTDVMRGVVPSGGDLIGITEAAWRHGTPENPSGPGIYSLVFTADSVDNGPAGTTIKHYETVAGDGTVTTPSGDCSDGSGGGGGGGGGTTPPAVGQVINPSSADLITYRNGPAFWPGSGDPYDSPPNGYTLHRGSGPSGWRNNRSIYGPDNHQPWEYNEGRSILTYVLPDGTTHVRIRGSFWTSISTGGAQLPVNAYVHGILSATSWDEETGDPASAGGWESTGTGIATAAYDVPYADNYVYSPSSFDVTLPVSGTKFQLHLKNTNTTIGAVMFVMDEDQGHYEYFVWTFIGGEFDQAALEAGSGFTPFAGSWITEANVYLALDGPHHALGGVSVEAIVPGQTAYETCTPDFTASLGDFIVDLSEGDSSLSAAGTSLAVQAPNPSSGGTYLKGHRPHTEDNRQILIRVYLPLDAVLQTGTSYRVDFGFYGDNADPQDAPRFVSLIIANGTSPRIQADTAGSSENTYVPNGHIGFLKVSLSWNGNITGEFWPVTDGPFALYPYATTVGSGTPIDVTQGTIINAELLTGSSGTNAPLILDLFQVTQNGVCADDPVPGTGCAECDDPNNPGTQIPPFTPGYMPTFRPQIGDPTTWLDSYICTFESGAMVLDWHTRGAVKVWGGELIPYCGKTEAQIVGVGGNLGNIRQAWLHWGQQLSVRSGQHWSDLIACLNEGRAVVVQGDYGEFTLAEKCQANFDGGHAVSIYPYLAADRLLVGDPLCHTFKGVRISTLQAYAEAMGAAVFGAQSPQPILFAVSRPWTP
jgi:hypothetical protein